MCLNFVFFKLIFYLIVCGVYSKLILKDYNKLGNVTIPSLDSLKYIRLKYKGYNFSKPLIPALQTTNQLSSNPFDFWEICHTKFFISKNHVSIITLDNDWLNPTEVYNKLGLVKWYTATDNLTFSKHVIIIVKTSSQFHKLLYSKQLWSQKTTFVIVLLECSLDIKVEMETLWLFHNIYKYVLVCGEQNTLLHMYQPYIPDKRERSKIFTTTNITEIVSNVVHAVDNLYGTQLRVVLFPQIPTAIIDRDGKYIGGADYLSLLVLQQMMNFSSVIYPPVDGQTFPQPDKKLSGSVQDLVTGKADIAFNGHFLQNYGINEVEMTRYVYMDKLCFVVAMPSFKSHYTIIAHIFSRSVWVLLIVVYFLTIYVYYVILKLTQQKNQPKKRFNNLFIQVYAIFIVGATTLKTNTSSQKLLIGGVLLGLMILNNTFQGALTTVLSRPSRNPFIDTIDQVTKSELALQSQHAETFVSDPDMLNILKALRQRKATNTNFIRLARFPLTHFQNYYTYMSISYSSNNKTEHLHTVQECIKSNYLSFVVPKKSPFLERINMYVQRFQESGLLTKWFSRDLALKNIFWPVEDEQEKEIPPKVFKVRDLIAIFYLLVYGLSLGTVVFLIESVVGRCKLLKTLCKR